VCLCVIKKPQKRRPRPYLGCSAIGRRKEQAFSHSILSSKLELHMFVMEGASEV
jgi:hypothetical protein